MSNSPTAPSKKAPASQPCVCCRERKHDGIPDADLDGYVCRPCKYFLRATEAALAKEGITGCVPEPR
ncbi:hypothetical protein [Horticoccus sp. 23ND18S-11]|uniref:hypothetical protein n=1 Tax=Horticoccus sp. 23ND18S-11 TaxID=3391832 RepID=UPI0039C9FAC6